MDTIDVNGETIAYRRAGRGDPLILIHSLGTASWLWEHQIARWSAFFDTIAIDARGHGASTRRGGFSVRGVASDIAALAEALKLGPARVVAISMGGPIAAHLADLAPKAVERLVIADSFATQGAAGLERARAIEAAIGENGMAEYARRYAADTLAPESLPEWGNRLTTGIAAMSAEAYVEAARSVFTADVVDLLKRIAVPTRVVVGTEDGRTPPRLSEEIAALVPGAELHLIEGARHLAHLDRPDAFHAAVEPFLLAAR